MVIAVIECFQDSVIAHENLEIILHIRNEMHTDSTIIHLHGMDQNDSPWADGVAFVLQCAILPGQICTVRFKAKPFGTSFYVTHIGDQRSARLYGPLIVIPIYLPLYPSPKTTILNIHCYDSRYIEYLILKTFKLLILLMTYLEPNLADSILEL